MGSEMMICQRAFMNEEVWGKVAHLLHIFPKGLLGQVASHTHGGIHYLKNGVRFEIPSLRTYCPLRR